MFEQIDIAGMDDEELRQCMAFCQDLLENWELEISNRKFLTDDISKKLFVQDLRSLGIRITLEQQRRHLQNQAATKIQAAVRGMLARKEAAVLREEAVARREEQAAAQQEALERLQRKQRIQLALEDKPVKEADLEEAQQMRLIKLLDAVADAEKKAATASKNARQKMNRNVRSAESGVAAFIEEIKEAVARKAKEDKARHDQQLLDSDKVVLRGAVAGEVGEVKEILERAIDLTSLSNAAVFASIEKNYRDADILAACRVWGGLYQQCRRSLQIITGMWVPGRDGPIEFKPRGNFLEATKNLMVSFTGGYQSNVHVHPSGWQKKR